MAEVFLVTVELRLRGPEGAIDRLADALIGRDEIATVWLEPEGRVSHVAVDISAEARQPACERATALVREACVEHRMACELVNASATTPVDRRALASKAAGSVSLKAPAGTEEMQQDRHFPNEREDHQEKH